MAKKTTGKNRSKAATPGASGSGTSKAIPSAVFGIGALLLGATIVTTIVLSLSYIPGFVPPGCGEGGGCDKLKDHVASRIPFINWPVAYVGLAYFAAALTTWMRSRKIGLAPTVVWIARLGGLMSVAYIVIMLQEGTICTWCLATHVFNLLFVGVVEFATPRDRATKSAAMWKTSLTVFASATVLAGGVQLVADQKERAKDDAEQERIVQEITGTSTSVTPPVTPPATPPEDSGSNVTITNPNPTQKHNDAIAQLVEVPFDLETRGPGRAGFTGRYLIGPEHAQVRIVAFSCLQCPDCRRVKGEIERILHANPETVSFSHKHYPFNSTCNEHVSRPIHTGSCQGSNLVEAAGLVGGPGAFWEMSAWAFDHLSRNELVNQSELDAKLGELGIDLAAFRHALNAAQIDDVIASDSDEGHLLGLSTTPMVFINGKEFRRWGREGNLERTVKAVLAQNPAPMDASLDRPLDAHAKLLNDWRQGQAMPDLESPWGYSLGAKDNPSATVTVYGCYSSGRTRELDRFIREYVNDHPDVTYHFRIFPMAKACNVGFKGMVGSGACEYARAVLAAGQLGGEDAFWKMHRFIMDRELMQGPGPTMLLDEVAKFAASREEAQSTINSDVVDQNLLRETQSDAFLARLRIEGVPRVFVNGKWVMNWRWEGHLIVYDALDAARNGAKP